MTHSLEPSTFGSSEPGPSAVWRWRLEDASGTEVSSSVGSPRFPSQSDAESWVGEVWRDLGVVAAFAVACLGLGAGTLRRRTP